MPPTQTLTVCCFGPLHDLARRYMTVDVPPFKIDDKHAAEVLRAADVLDL